MNILGVYVYTCIYIYTHVCIHIYIYIHSISILFISLLRYLFTFIHISTYIHIYIYTPKIGFSGDRDLGVSSIGGIFSEYSNPSKLSYESIPKFISSSKPIYIDIKMIKILYHVV
jgi:hypothetical protein